MTFDGDMILRDTVAHECEELWSAVGVVTDGKGYTKGSFSFDEEPDRCDDAESMKVDDDAFFCGEDALREGEDPSL